MAGALLERELSAAQSGRVSFDVARKSDDAEIRRVLRENPMAGRISISLEREPSYFAEKGEKETIVARVKGRVVGVGYCTKREGFVNGKATRVGYLGGLRLDARYAGRFDVLRRGYEFLRELQSDGPADFYFTTIASDNERARRFLEAGVQGMPKYEFVGEFVTVVVPTGGNGAIRFTARNHNYERESGAHGVTRPTTSDSGNTLAKDTPPDALVGKLVEFVNERNRLRQFAPSWSETEMAALKEVGLNASDFCVVSDGGRTVAIGALWDQRCFKQTVIRGYAAALALARPLFNVFGRVFKQPRLPSIGESLASAFASHFAAEGDDPGALVRLIGGLRDMARERGIELLTLGFAASDPSLGIIRQSFGGREYRSRMYVMHWPGIGKPAGELDGRPAGPEVALL